MSLPSADSHALAHSERLRSRIRQEIRAAGGWISFARYMELALYAPGLGYYSGGARKFGAAGDFVTAPELSPLFARSLAVQAQEILSAGGPDILEVGAGSGALAAELLPELERRGALPRRYAILELSGELRQRQEQRLRAAASHLLARVEWLETLPAAFSGLVLANELLDAMPVHLVAWREDGICECGVAPDAQGGLRWEERPARGVLLAAAETLPVSPPYLSEINLAARAWVAEWGRILQSGALLLIDYGFPRREYYHPQRGTGTLMCHYRHHAHDDPFHLPGLTDITAHVDFTALAEAGHAAGLQVLGYTSQAQFLLNCGIVDLLGIPATDPVAHARLAAGVQKLLSPSEMGELFKVMALGRGMETPLLGFRRGDRLHAL
ncbi:MAG: SAM-dependent methyltransferase [Pseudomonadota bacterium]|jgi:SAM-dependent MidA family methyltransferase